jgi:hypothetical protein
MMSRSSSFVRLGVVAAGALAGLCCAALPASAAPVVSLDCEAGISTYYCDASYSGNVSSVTITWTIDGGSAPAYNNETFWRTTCVKNVSYRIAVTVADTSGSGVASSFVTCGYPYP